MPMAMAFYSALIPASAISLPHFALSLWMNLAKASDDEGAGSAPRTRIFSIAAGSLNAFTKAAFNVLMIRAAYRRARRRQTSRRTRIR